MLHGKVLFLPVPQCIIQILIPCSFPGYCLSNNYFITALHPVFIQGYIYLANHQSPTPHLPPKLPLHPPGFPLCPALLAYQIMSSSSLHIQVLLHQVFGHLQNTEHSSSRAPEVFSPPLGQHRISPVAEPAILNRSCPIRESLSLAMFKSLCNCFRRVWGLVRRWAYVRMGLSGRKGGVEEGMEMRMFMCPLLMK
jgi:hypothetical protein